MADAYGLGVDEGQDRPPRGRRRREDLPDPAVRRGPYSDEYITTIGTKVSKRSLSLGHPAAEVEMAMQIWDVLGQKGYSGVQETAMKGAQGVLMVYDATADESRRSLEDYWMPAVWRLAGRVPMVIAGNKSDLVSDRVWTEDYLYFLGQKYACPAILTSARTGASSRPSSPSGKKSPRRQDIPSVGLPSSLRRRNQSIDSSGSRTR